MRRNQKLVKLNADLECNISLEDLIVKTGNPSELRRLYATWGFRKLLAALEGGPNRRIFFMNTLKLSNPSIFHFAAVAGSGCVCHGRDSASRRSVAPLAPNIPSWAPAKVIKCCPVSL